MVAKDITSRFFEHHPGFAFTTSAYIPVVDGEMRVTGEVEMIAWPQGTDRDLTGIRVIAPDERTGLRMIHSELVRRDISSFGSLPGGEQW